MLRDLPDELMTFVGPVLAVERPPQGGFYDVTILTTQRGRLVLKVGKDPERIAELHDECRVLADLHTETPFVPQPLLHVEEGDTGLFLFTCVKGENLLQVLEQASIAGRHVLLAGLGQALGRVHNFRPTTPNPTDWLCHALATAIRNVANGVVSNPVDHSGVFGGRNPRELLAEVHQWLEGSPIDLVYGHGDFCLPNVLADGSTVSGVIDWSRGGYTDRRIDLASGVWSIRHNLKDEAYVNTFLRAYGYTDTPDSLLPFEALWILS